MAALLKGAKREELKDRALAELKRAVALVDAKAPADAGSEGGFLGFGGVQVSDKEKATLAELHGVLGV